MILLHDEAATRALAMALGGRLRPGDAIGLQGELGVGKTVFARGLLAGLGYTGAVPSPTFPIAIPYAPPAVRMAVTHADLYRIEDEVALSELGLDDARTDGAVVIEWPERLRTAAWPGMLILTLHGAGANARTMTAIVPPGWRDRWPPR